MKNKWPLFFILIFVFLVGAAGVHYGLPLWLIADEPPFVLAALKMIQLKTLLPVFHQEDFQPFLYYPPYLSYFYLPFFVLILGVQFLFFNGTAQEFVNFIASDTTVFFIAARLLMVLLGVFSAFLIYQIAERIFRNRLAGVFSAFFLGTSLSYLALSATTRHWMPVAFIFVLTLFFLTYPDWSFRKRYLFSVLTLGVGSGISTIAVLGALLIVFWYFFYDQRSLREDLKDKFFYFLLFLFILLFIIPALLYPYGFGSKGRVTSLSDKSLIGFLESPIVFLKPVIVSEPVLAFWALIGLVWAFIKKEKFFLPLLLYVIFYGAIFYLFFRFEHRFVVPLVPFLAFFAGYGFMLFFQAVRNNFLRGLSVVTLLVPLISAGQLGLLAYRNDSREMARGWVEANIPAGSRILVNAPSLRLAANQEAIDEQRLLDPSSLRKVDEAEMVLNGNPRYRSFHALNLYTVQNKEFYQGIADYAHQHNYEYLVVAPDNNHGYFQRLIEQGILLQSFGDPQKLYSLEISKFSGSPFGFWRLKEFGPEVLIYKL